MALLAAAGSLITAAQLAIRDTEAWTPGSIAAGLVLMILVAGVFGLLLRVTLRR
jgi:hypothetical protein